MAIINPTKYVSVQRLSRFEAKLEDKYSTQVAQQAAVALLESHITNATLIPVDVDSLTPSTTFVKNNILGINGLMYRAKKNTSEFPVVLLVEDGHIVYDEDENGNKAFVVDDYTLSEDWEKFTDASIPRALELMAEQQSNFMEEEQAAMSSFENEIRISVAGVIKSTEKITASSGQQYTVRQILQAMAELMDKAIVYDGAE